VGSTLPLTKINNQLPIKKKTEISNKVNYEIRLTLEGLNQDKCDRDEKSVEDGIPPPKKKY